MVEELVKLRVSMARLGQVAGLNGDDLNIADKSYAELCEIALNNERGWNRLAFNIAEAIQALLNQSLFDEYELQEKRNTVRFLRDTLSKIHTIAEIAE
jgi:hypothetical protein